MSDSILQSWREQPWPIIKSSKPLPQGEGVIDENVFNTIEIDELFETINNASTQVGQAVLYRALCQPLSDLKEIQAKQNAIKELRDNTELKAKVERLVEQAAADEKRLYLLLFGQFLGAFGQSREENEIAGFGYQQYRNGVQFVLDLVSQIQAIGSVKSGYLQDLIAKVQDFTKSREYSLMQGPAYIVEGKIKSKEEKGNALFPIPVAFRPQLFKPVLISILAGFFWMLTFFEPVRIALAIPGASIFLGPLLLLYIPIVGGYDRDSCIIPLRNIYRESKAVGEFLDVLGQLDEMLSFIKFAENFPHQTCLPKLEKVEHHRINLVSAVNPVLGMENPGYVANDFAMDEDKLVLLTGPNSGGKTAFCKTLTQTQVLAQIGCYVTAKKAIMTVADKIFYQVPEISHLDDGEGRFGTELKRTKDIFLAATAKSLVVLDELSEGTTFEEKMESSSNVLNGFYRKGNSTILITHNHQLVDQFVKTGTGVPKQVEFANEDPTYRLISGISRVSHADRVAKKIGFSKEDIDNYLASE